jgi:Ca2+-binding RTX toxin-like protein
LAEVVPVVATPTVQPRSQNPFLEALKEESAQTGNTETAGGTDNLPMLPIPVVPDQPQATFLPVAEQPVGTNIVEYDDSDNQHIGTADAEAIYTYSGDDWVQGMGGNDIIVAGDNSAARVNSQTGEAETDSDTVYGNKGSDSISANSGSDFIYAGKDGDMAYGGKGDDIMFGDKGDDMLMGDKGNDILYGGNSDITDSDDNGSDLLYGGEGDDQLYGNRGSDSLSGGAGNDSLYGGKGDDLLEGGEGDDMLYGQQGIDVITGGIGNDYLDGGQGDDLLYGGVGDDTLTGGQGSDTFVLTLNEGSDIVTDFELSDNFALVGFTAADIEYVIEGEATTLAVNGQTLAILQGAVVVDPSGVNFSEYQDIDFIG